MLAMLVRDGDKDNTRWTIDNDRYLPAMPAEKHDRTIACNGVRDADTDEDLYISTFFLREARAIQYD